jgi:hypothetical protein
LGAGLRGSRGTPAKIEDPPRGGQGLRLHKGSSESRDSDDRIEEALHRIEERLDAMEERG